MGFGADIARPRRKGNRLAVEVAVGHRRASPWRQRGGAGRVRPWHGAGACPGTGPALAARCAAPSVGWDRRVCHAGAASPALPRLDRMRVDAPVLQGLSAAPVHPPPLFGRPSPTLPGRSFGPPPPASPGRACQPACRRRSPTGIRAVGSRVVTPRRPVRLCPGHRRWFPEASQPPMSGPCPLDRPAPPGRAPPALPPRPCLEGPCRRTTPPSIA